MKIFTLILTIAVAMTSCVSNKKYAELEAENTRLKALEAAVSSINKESERPFPEPEANLIHDEELKVLRKESHFLHGEIERLNAKVNLLDQGDLSPEQSALLQQQEMSRHEEEIMKANQQGFSKSDDLIAIEFRKISKARTAAQAVFADDNQVTITQTNTGLVISATNDHMFGSDQNSISASGETFLNRFTAVLEVSKGLDLSVVGVSAQSSKKAEASSRAAELDKKLLNNSTYKTFGASIESVDCDHSYSGSKSKCDRVEFVFQPDLDEALRLKQLGQ
jgi:flagellar motor protein MotB